MSSTANSPILTTSIIWQNVNWTRLFYNVATVNRQEKSSTQIATNDSATHATNDTMRSLLP